MFPQTGQTSRRKRQDSGRSSSGPSSPAPRSKEKQLFLIRISKLDEMTEFARFQWIRTAGRCYTEKLGLNFLNIESRKSPSIRRTNSSTLSLVTISAKWLKSLRQTISGRVEFE